MVRPNSSRFSGPCPRASRAPRPATAHPASVAVARTRSERRAAHASACGRHPTGRAEERTDLQRVEDGLHVGRHIAHSPARHGGRPAYPGERTSRNADFAWRAPRPAADMQQPLKAFAVKEEATAVLRSVGDDLELPPVRRLDRLPCGSELIASWYRAVRDRDDQRFQGSRSYAVGWKADRCRSLRRRGCACGSGVRIVRC